MTLNEELLQSRSNRKSIVTGYLNELKELYQIVVNHENAYGTDVMLMPDYAHHEVMSVVARATEIHTHIPYLRDSFEFDKSFETVDSEIEIMLR